MDAAMRSNDLPLNLFLATAAVPIPKDHPAYTGPPVARRGPRGLSVVVSPAQRAVAGGEAELQDVGAVAAPPPAADAMLFADSPPVDLAITTPGVDNTNRR